MKQGKQTCETLKKVRKQIALANDIDYEPVKCDHKGDCTGTCPACDAEIRYIEKQLTMRQRLGKAVAVAGLAVGIAAVSTGCRSVSNPRLAGMIMRPPTETPPHVGCDSTGIGNNLQGGQKPGCEKPDTGEKIIDPKEYQLDGYVRPIKEE